MQLYALDNHRPILAHHAKKGVLYRCPECLNFLQLRGGPHRQIHFYHLKSHRLCRQHQKSLTHLQVQWTIQSLLPQEEATLEHSFPPIGRIADICWENRNMIFEVQCSPISLEEAKNRCKDYKRIGLTPIWILHDRRYFNKKRMSAAESYLRKEELCFFTNIDEKGRGVIYDQQEFCQRGLRLFRGVKAKVDLYAPMKIPPFENSPLKQRERFSLLRLYRIFFHLILENV
jgi:competence protein CoiA